MTVDGVLVTGGPEEELVFVDLDTARGLSDKPGGLDVAHLSVQAQGETLAGLLLVLRSAVPQASAQPVKSVTRSEDLVLGKLGALVSVTAVVILLLTMVSLATTTLAVVAQRRTEIGLKRALGASRGGIVLEFLGESAATGLVGGLLGTGFGYLLARIMSQSVFARDIAFSPAIALFALGLALAVSAAACILPAAAAAATEPAPVLRGE
jgi:putative ABC transport system permease protein